MNPDKLNFFKFMLGSEKSDYVHYMVRDLGTQMNLEIASFYDEVEDLAEAKSVLNSFTLLGKTK